MVNINRKDVIPIALVAIVGLSKLLNRIDSPLPLDYRPAEDARQTVTSRMNEAAYLAQRTPESSNPRASIEGRVDNVRSCEDVMRTCIDMTVDGEAWTLRIDSPCDNPLKGRDINAEGVKTSFPNQIYVPGCDWKYVE